MTRNAQAWHHIAEFLDEQHLARVGLRMVTRPAVEGSRRGPACGEGPASAAAAGRNLPHGNHGENNLTTGRSA